MEFSDDDNLIQSENENSIQNRGANGLFYIDAVSILDKILDSDFSQ